MCGIYGLLNFDGAEISESLAGRLSTALAHRGPDHHGYYNQAGALLGINRLAILDLTMGNQPIFNEDRSLLIVYNGEIYNHLEVRAELEAKGHVFQTHTDTETVLHAYEEFGAGCATRFNGMFAFAIWRPRERRLFMARDRLGIKPLYFAPLERGFAFASEAKALLPLLARVRPNWTAIQRFFLLGYVPYCNAAFDGVQKFPPAHTASLGEKGLELSRYWRPEYGLGAEMNNASAREHLADLLDQAVKKELMSDVPVGVFLSGGLDSSAVAHYARKNSTGAVHSFALRFQEATHDESADARDVAVKLGLEHHELEFAPELLRRALVETANVLDEPFGDSTVLPLLALSKFTREHVKVVLTGWGGDEIFAGYPTYRAHQLARLYRRLPRWLAENAIPAAVRRLPVSDKYMSFEFKAKRFVQGMSQTPELQHFAWMGYFDEAGLRRLLRPEILAQAKGNLLDPVDQVVAELQEHDLVRRIMHLDAVFFLEGNGLFQADRMTMAASLEARVPLLNIDLLAFANALPSGNKMPHGRTKELLRQAMGPYLPPNILRKPKKGFGPPSSAWTRGIFADTIQNLFTHERVVEQGVLVFSEIQRLLAEHRARHADHGRQLWALLSFQLWYERFVLGRDLGGLIDVAGQVAGR
jgi:asparagine synthase (glutamine-hydrolysing)